mgnify:CR=1 FL=1
MKETNSVKSLKKQLMAAIAMVCVAAIALGTSTYAWFVNNTTVKAEKVDVTAKAANNLLITHGDGTTDANWGTVATLATYDSTNFSPVSTIGADSYKVLDFYKDTTWKTDTDGKYNASEFVKATAGTEYYKDTITLKASQKSNLYLDKETVFDIAAKTELATANNTATTLRVALVVKGTGVSTYDGAYIYQVDKDNLTDSYNTTLLTLNADGVKKAISGANASADIVGKNIDSTDGVTKYLYAGTTNTAPNLATTPTNNAMATEFNDADVLYQFNAPDDTVTIDVYIWMEGCDNDCNSSVVKNITQQKVTTTLGFCVGAAN